MIANFVSDIPRLGLIQYMRVTLTIEAVVKL
jgi:hypothetical protein